ncbi:MAG: sugar phosphate isomerase/epimerase family protein [Bacillota bacterium]|nr:sugar phosphate isomerase/epimerase family protein [Bacillota bacterium]
MKVAFSTLGCPGWSFEEIFATAKDLGMDGIEIRGIGKEMYAPKADIFLPNHIDSTIEKLKKANMTITMLTSGVTLADAAHKAENIQEAKDYIDLAAKLACPNVRIMGTNKPEPENNADFEQMRDTYREILDYAADKNVFPLLETNGVFSDSKVLADFIKEVDRENAFVLWDVHHPYRFFHESAEETAKNLSGLVKYVHVKDSAISGGKIEYRMMGYGDVPVLDALKALNEGNSDITVSLEWVKRWQPDLSEPGIVFYHFANYMQHLFKQL